MGRKRGNSGSLQCWTTDCAASISGRPTNHNLGVKHRTNFRERIRRANSTVHFTRDRGATPSQLGARYPGGDRSPTDANPPDNCWDSIRNILDETATQHVQRRLNEIFTRLRNAEQPRNRPYRQQQVSTLGNGPVALESSTNCTPTSIQPIWKIYSIISMAWGLAQCDRPE